MTKALEFDTFIVDIAPMTFKPLVLVEMMLEVKPEKVETTPIIVAPGVPLPRPLADNAAIVATNPEIV